jgi:hypothetical protein
MTSSNPVKSDGMAEQLASLIAKQLLICSVKSPNQLSKERHEELRTACEHYLSVVDDIIRIRDDQIAGARLGAIRKEEKKAAALAATDAPRRTYIMTAIDADFTELEA